MAIDRDEMMEWVFGEVDAASEDGITIQELLGRFRHSFANGDPQYLWECVLTSDRVQLSDNKIETGMRKLGIDEVLKLGLGGRTVCRRSQDVATTTEEAANFGTHPEISISAPRSKRGRPRKGEKIGPAKSKTDSSVSNLAPRVTRYSSKVNTAVSGLTSSNSTWEPKSDEFNTLSNTRRSSQRIATSTVALKDYAKGHEILQAALPQVSSHSFETDSGDVYQHSYTSDQNLGRDSISKSTQITRQPSKEDNEELFPSPLQYHERNINHNLPQTQPDPTEAQALQTHSNPAQTPNTPVRSSAKVSSNGPSTFTRSRVPRSISESASILPIEPVTPMRMTKGKMATYQSHDQHEYEQSIARVYINYPGTEVNLKIRGRGRKKASTIALFKSEKLKDPEFLEKNHGQWKIKFAQLMAEKRLKEQEKIRLPKKRQTTEKSSKTNDTAAFQSVFQNSTFAEKNVPIPVHSQQSLTASSADAESATLIPEASLSGKTEGSLVLPSRVSQFTQSQRAHLHTSNSSTLNDDHTYVHTAAESSQEASTDKPNPPNVAIGLYRHVQAPYSTIDSATGSQNLLIKPSSHVWFSMAQTYDNNFTPTPKISESNGLQFPALLAAMESQERAYKSPYALMDSSKTDYARSQPQKPTAYRLPHFNIPQADHGSISDTPGPSQQQIKHNQLSSLPLIENSQQAELPNRHSAGQSESPGMGQWVTQPVDPELRYTQASGISSTELPSVSSFSGPTLPPEQPPNPIPSMDTSTMTETQANVALETRKKQSSQSQPAPNQKPVKRPDTQLLNENRRKRALSKASKDSHIADQSPPTKRLQLDLGTELTVSIQPREFSISGLRKMRNKDREEALSKAQSTSVPETVTRIAAIYDDEPGNLLLAGNKTTVDFFALGQHPPQLPTFVIPVISIKNNPVTSTKGSKPMQLRIVTRDDLVHTFLVSSLDHALEALGVMRAKIVEAMILVRLLDADQYQAAEYARLKPFKCDLCDNRFKNKGGLEYHITKSNTTCNPNFDPATFVPKRRGGPTKTAPKTKEVKASDTKGSTRRRKSQSADTSTTEVSETSNGSDLSTSEDSVYAWAENVATTNYQRQRRISFSEQSRTTVASKSKQLRNLPGEKELLEAFVEEVGSRPRRSSNARDLTDQRCAEIILSIINGHDGIFPGDKSIWFALVALWMEENVDSKILPELKLCYKIMNRLVREKKLERLDFEYQDRDLLLHIRSIFTTQKHDPDSQQMHRMKSLIEFSHPAVYVPPAFAPRQLVFEKLQAISIWPAGSMQSEDEVLQGRDERVGSVSTRRSSASTLATTTLSGGFEFSQYQQLTPDDDLTGPGIDSMESNMEISADERGVPAHSQRAQSESKERHSKDILKSWDDIRGAAAGKDQNKQWLSPFEQFNTLSLNVKTRSAATTNRILHSWSLPALTLLPNTQTGAWELPPVCVRALNGKGRRIRLPESITFLQDKNGSWSHRAYGHGVSPIFSRPRRRTDGNPHLDEYLKKIRSGFRPIMYPSPDKRFRLPTIPSRILPSDKTPPKNRQSRKKKEIDLPDKRTGSEEFFNGQNSLPSKPARRSARQQSRRSPSYSSAGSLTDHYFSDERDSEEDKPKRITRNSAKKARPLIIQHDQTHLFNTVEPRKLGLGDPKNPGVETLPASFGLSSNSTTAQIEMLTSYDALNFVEYQIIGPQNEIDLWTKDMSWVLADTHGPFSTLKVRWDEGTAFTVDTLPYSQLSNDFEEIDSSKRTEPPTKKKKKNPQKDGCLFDFSTEVVSFTRPLTALPADLEGVKDDVQEAAKFLSVEVAKPSESLEARKRFRNSDTMTDMTEIRFAVAVIIIRTLTGGLELQIDWVLLSTLFDTYSISHLVKAWAALQNRKTEALEQLSINFQSSFVAAYKAGEVAPIDYNHLVDYDWSRLIDWTMENIDTSLSNKPVELPGSRHDLQEIYTCTEVDRIQNSIQEKFYGVLTPVYKRTETLASLPYSLDAVPRNPTFKPKSSVETVEIDDLKLAKSWARSTALTPEADWNKGVAARKLQDLGEKLVSDALTELKDEKIIVHRSKGRSTHSRSYEATDLFAATLRKSVPGKTYSQAVIYKAWLDDQFKSGVKCVRADYYGDGGTYMALSSLAASGRIGMVGVNVPHNRWGLGVPEGQKGPSGYETKRLVEGRLRWEIDIFPTTSYHFHGDDDFVWLVYDETQPPRSNQRGEIPAWYGITDKLMPDWWKRIITAVVGTVALRSGIDLTGLRRVFKPTLELWELKLLLEWSEAIGLIERLDADFEGWGVTEWWWMILGKIQTAY